MAVFEKNIEFVFDELGNRCPYRDLRVSGFAYRDRPLSGAA